MCVSFMWFSILVSGFVSFHSYVVCDRLGVGDSGVG